MHKQLDFGLQTWPCIEIKSNIAARVFKIRKSVWIREVLPVKWISYFNDFSVLYDVYWSKIFQNLSLSQCPLLQWFFVCVCTVNNGASARFVKLFPPKISFEISIFWKCHNVWTYRKEITTAFYDCIATFCRNLIQRCCWWSLLLCCLLIFSKQAIFLSDRKANLRCLSIFHPNWGKYIFQRIRCFFPLIYTVLSLIF